MAQTGSILLILALLAGLSTSQTLSIAASAQDSGHEKAKTADQGSNGSKDKNGAQDSGTDKAPEMTPEQKMQARFPQPAKVSHLIGLPVLDENDSTIGYVQQVVRTPEGKVQLIVPYGRQFGWARMNGLLGWSRRLVAVPIEVVAILALQINAVDMDRGAFEKAPTWVVGQGQAIPPGQTVNIALGRR